MTTKNTPVGTPTEKDEDGRRSSASNLSVSEQPPSDETVPPADDRHDAAAEHAETTVSSPPSSEPTSVLNTSADSPAGSDPSSESTESGSSDSAVSSTEQNAPSPESPAPAASSTTEQTPSSPRRVRLNPTINPDALKPIPTLRSSETSSASAPPQNAPTTAKEQKTDEAVESGTPATPGQSTQTQEEPQQQASQTSETATGQAADQSTAPPPPPAEPVAIPAKNESLDAGLEAELEAAMAQTQQEPETVAQLEDATVDTQATAPSPDLDVKRGTRLKGTVQSIHGDDMFLDFGLRMAGILSRRQFGLRKQPMQGEPLDVVVHRVDEKEGLIHVNLPTGTSKVRGDWDALTVDQNVECMVNGTNKGGLEVSVGSLRGFMPASQVELGYVPDLNVYIGQKLKARVAEVNPKRRKLVLSRRSLLEEEREQSQQELFENVQPGQQYTGRVKTIKDYGAFVDIGGADGLLHVAQISWTRINHPSELLTEGQEVEVQVLSVDKDKKKISLGMRQLTQNPWKAAESKYSQGSQVTGKVTRIENFGAFVELEEGVEGLVHISELDHKRVNKVTEVLRVGQEVEVQILEVDPKRKRVGLSVKALKEKPEEPSASESSSPIKRQRSVDSLVGGMGEPTGGQLFGDPSKFGR